MNQSRGAKRYTENIGQQNKRELRRFRVKKPRHSETFPPESGASIAAGVRPSEQLHK